MFVQFHFSYRQLFLFVPRPVHSGTGERFYQSKEAKCAAKRAPPKSSRINFPISFLIFTLEDNCFQEWIKFARLGRVETGSPPHLDCGLGKLTKTKTDKDASSTRNAPPSGGCNNSWRNSIKAWIEFLKRYLLTTLGARHI